MTSLDSTNTAHNHHGGSAGTPDSSFQYDLQCTGATMLKVGLLHFDLSGYIGKTFNKVRLRFHSNRAQTDQVFHVAQCVEGWTVGNGGGAASTSGPTWASRDKTGGGVAWLNAVTSAGFIDVAGQSEQAATGLNAGSSPGYTTAYEVDITGMANRALTTYNGHLYLRLRVARPAGSVSPTVAGPTARMTAVVGVGNGYGAGASLSNFVTRAGYRTYPHLRIREADPIV